MNMPNQTPFDEKDELSVMAQHIVRELKATSDLVVDAAKLGKDELLHYVSEGIRSSWISSGDPNKPREARTHYTEEFKKQQQVFDERRAARKEAEQKQPSPKKKAKKHKIDQVSKSSPLWLIGGGLFLIPVVVGLADLIIGSSSLAEALAPAGVSALLAAFPLWKGLSLKKQEKFYDRYRSAVGSSPRMKLETLAALTHRSYGEAVKDVTDMVNRGYFGSEAILDSKKGILIVDPDAPEAEEAPFVAAASVEAEPAESYEAMLLELRLLNERIEDEEMSNRIYRIEAVAKATFLAVREKPEKRSQIQRFMDYYLPTTIKLLSAYADFEKQTVEGENIRKSKENIENMTQTLSEAFEKQFDSLFKAETLDINAEIRTMDSLLRQDGFVGGFQMPKS